jgi:hypothetical protein
MSTFTTLLPPPSFLMVDLIMPRYTRSLAK